jgi:carboxypeptidase Taq
MSTLSSELETITVATSDHPFCGGVPEDIRLTTCFDENNFSIGLMGACHESGHALYEMGLSKKHQSQPIGQSLGMA